MKNILVTGGAGFIGSNFIRYILEGEGSLGGRFQVVNLDALTYAGSMENLHGLPETQHTFIAGNICDQALVEDLLQRYSIDTIVHFAAESHVDRSILGPQQFIQTNIVGTFTLLEAARKSWAGQKWRTNEAPVRFHHVSTDEVFGALEVEDPPFCETTCYAPRSPYAASKASSDHLVRAYGHTYELPFTITNCSNNYGPYQFPEKLIPLMIANALQGKALPVYGDGQQVRDWLYVEDHCEAILAVLQGGAPGETYTIGGGNQPTNLKLVQSLCNILDELRPESPDTPHNQLIRFVSDRPGHDRRYAMDIDKIHQQLGWSPRHSLESGLQKTIAWYLEHPEWIEAVSRQKDYQGWITQNYTARA
jgi:dTDP-glucose 4,6-dehydratase